ncbi:MAG TPA: phytanoyl-CoA dioxygenase family protein [Planctomycetota bacterium]|nr:phytanoyl-CoA dioxygenase family protein [Planctomycetota bacterium]
MNITDTELLPRQPLAPAETTSIVQTFQRDGVAVLGKLFDAAEVAALKAEADRVFSDPTHADNLYSDFIAVRLFECSRLFRDLIVREPLISVVESLLGPDCHLIANNMVRNRPGQAIDSFHADDFVWFPLPPELPRFDSRMTFPTFILGCHIALTDLESDEFGPLQYVPGSHYSGRQPADAKKPEFEDRPVRSILVEAGTVYLQHPQVWHRGAPNTSTRTRYILQYAYGMRFIAQRFYPFLNYRMPHHVLEGANERMLRLLGKHPKGAYG